MSKHLTLSDRAIIEKYLALDKVIIYYDNGQIELTKILTSVFSTLYTHVEFRKMKPVDYKLIQIANLICTMELLAEKAETNSFTHSEIDFYNLCKMLLHKNLIFSNLCKTILHKFEICIILLFKGR